MNPTDLARERWKPYRQAQERVEKAAGQHAQAREDLAALEAQLPIAERDDSLALGLALLDGKSEPAPTAAKVREEIAAQQRRVKALEAAVQEAHNELAATIEAHKPPWFRDAMGETAKARTRYESALAELEASRANLSAAVGLFEWVSSGGASTAEPATNQLAGSGHSFAEVLAALRADLEHLVSFDPHERDGPARVAFERISRVLG
jgi:chromosome segregation ATPase